jgi:hypothetical protein
MSSRRTPRQLIVAVLVGVLVGGGLLAVTPAGAEVSQSVATNWKKIWKKNLKPLADKRYYTKKKSNARYQPKGSYETAGSGYSKAETYSKSETYSKAEIDAKLALLVNSKAASASGGQSVNLVAADTVVRSVSLTPSADGTVVVSSSAYTFTGTTASVRCSLTTGTSIDSSHLQYAIMPDNMTESLAGTRAFPATKDTPLTVNLVCDLLAGTANIQDSALTAIFAPS